MVTVYFTYGYIVCILIIPIYIYRLFKYYFSWMSQTVGESYIKIFELQFKLASTLIVTQQMASFIFPTNEFWIFHSQVNYILGVSYKIIYI